VRFLGADTGRRAAIVAGLRLTPSEALWAHSDDGLEDGGASFPVPRRRIPPKTHYHHPHLYMWEWVW
jgi:hypothetical protein